MYRISVLTLLLLCAFVSEMTAQEIVPGAARMGEYLRLLAGKKVALVVNQTSVVGNRLLADTLLKRAVRISKIFVPEHGFRGTGDAGAHIGNSLDSATGLPVISLYGNNRKPSASQLADVDIVVYDLQDVGVRFYTYISTLQYVMEACAENDRPLMILDRPNPHGGYIDGPILDTALRSFIGMQPIPVVYGMTPGEYARMLVGERWISNYSRLKLEVIKCSNWRHSMKYKLPVAPSPNLRSMDAIYLYPSICFFEGTVISVGRGTDKPFRQWGHPEIPPKGMDSFRPVSTVGAVHPVLEGKTCYGHIAGPLQVSSAMQGINLDFLLEMYRKYPDKKQFFTPFFERLAGTAVLRKQIISGLTAGEIKASWQPGLTAFAAIRKKYLLYP